MTLSRMAIAKYRKDGFPKEWFLTDFTMEQVEGRLENLEAENARLREALRECVEATEAVDEWKSGEAPSFLGGYAFDLVKVARAKAREVLGDD